MLWALTGLLAGIIIGISTDITIPIEYIKYTAVIIIAIVDAIFGGLKAEISQDKFKISIFISGLLFSTLMALGITLLGEKLGLDLYLAVSVVFTLRIFKNLGKIRRGIIKKLS